MTRGVSSILLEGSTSLGSHPLYHDLVNAVSIRLSLGGESQPVVQSFHSLSIAIRILEHLGSAMAKFAGEERLRTLLRELLHMYNLIVLSHAEPSAWSTGKPITAFKLLPSSSHLPWVFLHRSSSSRRVRACFFLCALSPLKFQTTLLDSCCIAQTGRQ